MADLKKLEADVRAIVGDKGVLSDEEDMAPFLTEQRGRYAGKAPFVVRPQSADEVSAVVKLCNEADVGIVPMGGNTGLVGGGVADGEVILSLARMNKIRDIDVTNHTMTVDAGCILAEIQEAADEAGTYFPLSLGAEGSCQIGGNLATNAGGVNVLRYGNARELVLGLEVVLADGRVLSSLKGLRKDNTGYDLKQLFLGSEGTLGIITGAVLKLFAKPLSRETALAAVPDIETVLKLYNRTQELCGDTLIAFEMISRSALAMTAAHIDGVKDPFEEPHAYYALIDLASPRANAPLKESLEDLLAGAFEEGWVEDAVIAASGQQAEELWHMREAIPEAQKFEGGSIKHDISVPISRVAEFVEKAGDAVKKEIPGVRPVPFGHVGDGNVHFNLSQPEDADAEGFLERWEEINRIVHDIAADMGGSFSAEHGVGKMKRDELLRYKSQVEVDLMRALKKTLDPKGILNPGKVF